MELKVSHFRVISDHAYRNNDGNSFRYILSGRTGDLVALDLESAKLVQAGELPHDRAVLDKLLQAKLLVEKNEDEIKSITERNIKSCSDGSVVNFTILPSAHCNMNCSYCGQTHQPGAMDRKVYSSIIRRISSAIRNPETKIVHIQWFGGEPMVAFSDILKISKHLTRISHRHKVRYVSSIVTNGTLLTIDKVNELYHAAGVSEICITLDGPSEVHDLRRPLIKGTRNFDHIVDLLKKVKMEANLKNLRFVLRSNIDRLNAEYIERYLASMKECGFDSNQFIYDLHAVYPWSNNVAEIELSKSQYAAQEVHWMIQMLHLGLKFSVLPTEPHEVVCVAVKKHAEVLDSSGEIYSCTEHPLVQTTQTTTSVGKVTTPWPGQRPDGGMFDDFNSKILNGTVPCSNCVLLGVCGGACPKHWAEGHYPCPSFKFNLQARLDIAAVAGGNLIL